MIGLPKSDRARVFFALWPPDDAQRALAAAAEAARTLCGGRATPAEKIHLTLFFIGAIERTRLPALERIGTDVRASAFDLAFDRVGYWRHNGIVWAGARDAPTELRALAGALRTALEREGIRGEDRPYIPHVTLVRDASRRPAPAPLLSCAWRVRDFVLVQSVPVAGGVRYEGIRAWPLI